MSRGVAIACAIAAGFGCAPGAGGAAAAGGGCAQAGSTVGDATLRETDHSVLCLVNRERATRGLAPLRGSRTLTRSARSHSRDMVARRYFSHVSPNGASVRQRLVRAGYLRNGRQVAAVGETITWTPAGPAATPADLVRSFMRSAGHRAIVLDRGYRDIGIGLAHGAPVAGASGATLTLTFGRR